MLLWKFSVRKSPDANRWRKLLLQSLPHQSALRCLQLLIEMMTVMPSWDLKLPLLPLKKIWTMWCGTGTKEVRGSWYCSSDARDPICQNISRWPFCFWKSHDYSEPFFHCRALHGSMSGLGGTWTVGILQQRLDGVWFCHRFRWVVGTLATTIRSKAMRSKFTVMIQS